MDTNLTHGDDMPMRWLSKTDWKDSKDPIIGALIPNLCITYFGQVLPHGNISEDEIMAKLFCLSSGYKLWANTANNAVKNWMTFLVSWKKSDHLNPSRSTSTRLGMLSPFLLLLPMACGAMTLVQSNDYPVAAHVIKELFQFSPHVVAPSFASSPPGNVTLHLPAKVDKESEAKKGVVKLMLLHMRGNIDMEATSVSSVNPATLSKGMQVVLNQPCAA
jgi:hypothetical protein